MFPGMLNCMVKSDHKNAEHDRQIKECEQIHVQIRVFEIVRNNCPTKEKTSEIPHNPHDFGEIFFGMFIEIEKIKRKSAIEIIENNLQKKTSDVSENYRIILRKKSSHEILETIVIIIIST